jgi:hypothetical protein
LAEFNNEAMTPLDKFGKFFVQNLRDKALENLEFMLVAWWKAPELQTIQSNLAELPPDARALVREVVEKVLTAAMHDLLFAFQESHDGGTGIEVIVDGKPAAELSDGLQGEIFGEDGWIVRYSKFGSQTEIDRSRWADEKIKRMLEKDRGEEQ